MPRINKVITDSTFCAVIDNIKNSVDKNCDMNSKLCHDNSLFFFGYLAGSKMHKFKQRWIIEFIPINLLLLLFFFIIL